MISVIVDSSDVERLLSRMIIAISPPALSEFFLEGAVDPYLAGRVEARFESEGDSAVGGKWEPLSEATIVIRESQGFPGAHPINKRTGIMEHYMTSGGSASADLEGAVLEYPGDPGGELADKILHAQGGGVSASGKPYPARPVIALDEEDLAAVLVMLEKYLYKSGHGGSVRGELA